MKLIPNHAKDVFFLCIIVTWKSNSRGLIRSMKRLISHTSESTHELSVGRRLGIGVKISPRQSQRPRFRDQIVIDHPIVKQLDEENTLSLQHNFLNDRELAEYLQYTSEVERYGGRSAYNSIKPRIEVCYTASGDTFRYSNHNHITKKFPAHTLPVVGEMLSSVGRIIPNNKYQTISSGIDILYNADFERGGSADAHGDKEKPWGLVTIFSLGQTRWLRVRRIADGTWYNVEMRHNSLVAMHGASFQTLYTHQVDRLAKDEAVYPRLSFNVRFLEGPSNLAELMSTTEHTSPTEISDETTQSPVCAVDDSVPSIPTKKLRLSPVETIDLVAD